MILLGSKQVVVNIRSPRNSGSFSSRCRRRRPTVDEDISDKEESQWGSTKRTSITSLIKQQDDVALCKDLIRSPFRESTIWEYRKHNDGINRELKVPPIEQLYGSSDHSDFIRLFDGCISFFGHSEIATFRFFSTCLKGTALCWFNNLPPRSIDSWACPKGKFRTRF